MEFINPLDNSTVNTNPLETGPLDIKVYETDTGDRELHLSFNEAFRTSNLQKQTESFKNYIDYLVTAIQQLEESDKNRLGMMNILQICEQLLPHIEAEELDLEETIVGTMQEDDPHMSNPIDSIRLS